ncbi:hypothetical protein [Epilithonimonas sp.]|nr:hypothetical protein [Epilithonimonas sp.]
MTIRKQKSMPCASGLVSNSQDFLDVGASHLEINLGFSTNISPLRGFPNL